VQRLRKAKEAGCRWEPYRVVAAEDAVVAEVVAEVVAAAGVVVVVGLAAALQEASARARARAKFKCRQSRPGAVP
jgi:hypothetical protein